MTLLEVCVDSAAGARAALAGGAHRLELCARLDLDGLTPEPELRDTVLDEAAVPVHVMIRPRPGGFVYTDRERRRMHVEIAAVKTTRATGVVLGALALDGTVDQAATASLVRAARPLSVTFHRAFDRVPDPLAALDTLVELGVDRVLTSGGAPSASAGTEVPRALVQRADGRIVVMAGGGVRAHNAAAIVARTGVDELHGSRVFTPP